MGTLWDHRPRGRNVIRLLKWMGVLSSSTPIPSCDGAEARVQDDMQATERATIQNPPQFLAAEEDGKTNAWTIRLDDDGARHSGGARVMGRDGTATP